MNKSLISVRERCFERLVRDGDGIVAVFECSGAGVPAASLCGIRTDKSVRGPRVRPDGLDARDEGSEEI